MMNRSALENMRQDHQRVISATIRRIANERREKATALHVEI
jgi:hypothetical protein